MVYIASFGQKNVETFRESSKVVLAEPCASLQKSDYTGTLYEKDYNSIYDSIFV